MNAQGGLDPNKSRFRKILLKCCAVFASPGASAAAATALQMAPKEVETGQTKRRRSDPLGTSAHEIYGTPVTTYGHFLSGARARVAPTKTSFDKAQEKAKSAARASWAKHNEWVERTRSHVVAVPSSASLAELCIHIVRKGESAADKDRYAVTDGLSGARRGGIHYLYDGPMGAPDESDWGGKGGTVALISALLFIPSGSAAAVRKVLVDCQKARLAGEKYDLDGGVKLRGRQAVIRDYSNEAYLVYQSKKVGMPIGETTIIVNEYLRNNEKPEVSWSAWTACSWCWTKSSRRAGAWCRTSFFGRGGGRCARTAKGC